MKIIKTLKNEKIKIDNKLFIFLNQYNWRVVKPKWGKYAEAYINNRHILMHRLIMKASKKQIVDHRNGDGLDNQIKNLRFCTKSQNAQNRGKQNNNTSGYKGVWFFSGNSKIKLKKRWVAELRKNKKRCFFQYFNTAKEAARAYNKKAKELFGEFAILNKI